MCQFIQLTFNIVCGFYNNKSPLPKIFFRFSSSRIHRKVLSSVRYIPYTKQGKEQKGYNTVHVFIIKVVSSYFQYITFLY